MAFADRDTVNKIRDNIKRAFNPKDGWKFSITGTNSPSVGVALMRCPEGYKFKEYTQLNQFHLRRDVEALGWGAKEYRAVLKMKRAVDSEHWDKSDSMIDYFHCAFYYTLNIGRWDRQVEKKS